MSTLIYTESSLDPANAVYDSTLPAGEGWMHEIHQGQTFRIVDLEGNQAVDTLFYRRDNPSERYSAQDTIREQGGIYLTTGTRLLSSEGNVLLTIVADTCGRHDTLGGACSAESNQVRYALDKRPMHSCRDTFLNVIGRYGKGFTKRDLTHNINFFMNVPVTPDGGLSLCGWRERRRPLCRDARRDGRPRADLELPAAEQPVQRLQPHPGAPHEYWD